jgi:phosphoribosyl 1,2-cyclic phosphodiesterase
MRFASLGSGSEGNALLVETQDGTRTTRVLLDCGFSAKEVERRLARLQLSVADLDALVITHEHTDHIGSALTLAKRAALPIHMSWGTALMVGADAVGIDLQVMWGDEVVLIGDMELLPYTVPHDAREPLQFVFDDGRVRLGVLTDAGETTPHIIKVLGGCNALVLECNHDRAMLAASRYPASLKARIGGSHGHLSNEAAAGILQAIDRSCLQTVVAAHLSQQNNDPALVRAALAAVLGRGADMHADGGVQARDGEAVLAIATQGDGVDWRQV